MSLKSWLFRAVHDFSYVAKGFDLSMNGLELDRVEFSPVSFYIAVTINFRREWRESYWVDAFITPMTTLCCINTTLYNTALHLSFTISSMVYSDTIDAPYIQIKENPVTYNYTVQNMQHFLQKFGFCTEVWIEYNQELIWLYFRDVHWRNSTTSWWVWCKMCSQEVWKLAPYGPWV